MCIFCRKLIPNPLSRHITRCHNEVPEVKEAMKLPKKQKHQRFHSVKLQGILQFNKSQTTLDNPCYQRERWSHKTDNAISCSGCSTFISQKAFSRHRKGCCKITERRPQEIISMRMALIEYGSKYAELNLSNEFKNKILERFCNDEVGRLCKSDQTILNLGSVFYGKIKRRKDKTVQVRRSVRAEMRGISTMYLLLLKQPGILQKFGDAMDMFCQENFPQLRTVIEEYTTSSDDSIKAGLKQNIYYLLKRAGRTLRTLLSSFGKDGEAEFLELWDDLIFGDAVYETNKRREVYLRKPEQLPNEEDMRKVRDHILKRMLELVSNTLQFHSAADFVELRDLALARLIIVNGRRDGEPSRLCLSDWVMAKNDEWIDKQRLNSLDDFDRMLIKSLKVTYITGKGNRHLVPLLILEDTVDGLNML